MAKKNSKRHSDAASIVGELADDLEAKSQEIVGRASPGIDPAAVILKDEHGFPPGEEEGEEGTATGTADEEVPEEEVERAYGGAITLNQAESFLVREKGDAVLLGDWDILAGVLTNIAGAEKGPAISEEIKQFQSRIDVMAVKALASLQQKESIMPEDTLVEESADQELEAAPETPEGEAEPVESGEAAVHVLDESMVALRAAFDEALATPIDEESRLRMVQENFNALGLAIKASITEGKVVESEAAPASEGITLEQIQQVVQSVVAPMQAKLASLENKDVSEIDNVPERRAVSVFEARSSSPDAERLMAASEPAFTETRPASQPTGRWHMPEKVDRFSGGFEGATPRLNALIRRTVTGK